MNCRAMPLLPQASASAAASPRGTLLNAGESMRRHHGLRGGKRPPLPAVPLCILHPPLCILRISKQRLRRDSASGFHG